MTDTVNETEPGLLSNVTRRRFLGGTAGALVVLSLETSLPSGIMGRAAAAGAATATQLTVWISVNDDNTVTVRFGGAEMGQGAMTGLLQAVAEEMKVAWSQVKYEFAPPDQSYITGGSWAIRANLAKMRTAGAAAKEMLVAAAAAQWSVSPATLTVANGVITNPAGPSTLKYSDVAAAAALLPVPTSPTLSNPADWTIIGTTVNRLDIPSKVDGSAIYGLDVRVPNMVYAAVRNSPVAGGTLVSTPATPAGVIKVVGLGGAVAAVSTNSWAAMRAVQGLSVSWRKPADATSRTSSTILTTAKTLMASGTPGSPLPENVGSAATAYASAVKKVEATYSVPYLAHTCMEVPNCTVDIRANSAEVWLPTQAPQWVVGTVASITGLPASAITVHPMLLGGGFGRRIDQDYVAQAVSIGKALGQPVKVMWSREEDLGHGQYRPMGLMRVRIGLDGTGAVTSYQTRHVSPSPVYQRGWMGPTGNDNTDGATDTVYSGAIANRLVEYVRHPSNVPTGFWRAVSEAMNGFAVESAIDEAALAAGVDPLAFRQKLLAGNPRALAVVNAAAAGIGWSTPPATGVARGLAIGNGFGSIVAAAIEVTKATTTVNGVSTSTMRVLRVSAAIDCGMAVNPGQVKRQLEGGIIQGIGSALWNQTTFSSGVASTRNFSNNRMLLMSETPAIDVQIIPSDGPLGGVGETGVPVMAPAMANAWAKLTGTRLRSLPFFPSQNWMDD